ncbi:hypothetical protein D3C84_934270 [compost metagenome]
MSVRVPRALEVEPMDQGAMPILRAWALGGEGGRAESIRDAGEGRQCCHNAGIANPNGANQAPKGLRFHAPSLVFQGLQITLAR